MKKITFYPYLTMPDNDSWFAVRSKISSGDEDIETSQMGLLDSSLIDVHGYRIFVNDGMGVYEIGFGHNERTHRELRLGHNFFRMWASGEFDC